MASVVRETVSKIITIENPLNKPIDIKKEMLLSDNENVSFNPNTFTIQSHSVNWITIYIFFNKKYIYLL
jgi:hypothetical protein